MYQALYRKWRPQRFADVVGQQAITSALSNQILAGKLGHAYLFTGTRGTGKTSCAKIFAKAVNCENPQGAEPCGTCPACVGLDNGSILDVAEIDAASNNSVDDIRDLRDETVYRPSYCRYRVYIIDEVHMLSTQAFNALLKILEEPPSHVLFILATTEIHKVPATILSRCQRYDFYRIRAEDIAERLSYIAAQENIQLTAEAADLIARIADGSMRDAISLLDTCAGLGEAVNGDLVRKMAGVADKSYLFAISAAVASGDVAGVMRLVGELREMSIDVRRLGEELAHHYRNLLLAKADATGGLLSTLPAEDRQTYVDTARNLPEHSAIEAIRRIATALDRMLRSPDPRIELELALFDLCEGQALPQARPKAMPAQLKAAPPAAAPAQERPAQPVAAALPQPVPEPEAQPAAAPPEPQLSVPPADAPLEAAHLVPFENWEAVLADNMIVADKMLHSYMHGSTAYIDGKRVLIQGGDLFLSFMKNNADTNERIKAAIQNVTGKRYGIGPYKGEAPAPEQSKKTAMDTLKEWEAMGVKVEYTNPNKEAES